MLLKKLLEQQAELMEAFHGLEGFPLQLEINNKSHQMLARDYAWRISEEFGEWTLAHEELLDYVTHNVLDNVTTRNKETARITRNRDEEMMDVLSFTLGLASLYNLDVSSVPQVELSTGYGDKYHRQICDLNRDLVSCINLLKAKSWRQSFMMTNTLDFMEKLAIFVGRVWGWCLRWLFPGDIDKAYQLKNQKNWERIKNGY